MYCTIRIVKTKALISCTVTAQLIGVFVFAKAKVLISHETAHFQMESVRNSVTVSQND